MIKMHFENEGTGESWVLELPFPVNRGERIEYEETGRSFIVISYTWVIPAALSDEDVYMIVKVRG